MNRRQTRSRPPSQQASGARPSSGRQQSGGGRAVHGGSDRAGQLVLAVSSSLLVATLLIPGESAGPMGTGILLVALWLLLLTAWTARAALRREVSWHGGWLDVGFLAFFAWLAACTFPGLAAGNGRLVLNSTWHWLGLGAAFFTWRQVLHDPRQQRAMVALLLALAAMLSGHGIYQYAVTIPAQIQDYEARTETQKQRLLSENQLDPTPGSASRRQFENRLRSTEPFATFGLANSLAGVLAPGLILLLGITVDWHRSTRSGSRGPLLVMVLVMVATAGIMGACLLLTKSRTAWGAVALGSLLLWLLDWRTNRRIGWKLPAGVAASLLILVVLGVVGGSLDWQVVTEARLSRAYRAEYWQATVAMIGDHPLWGIGPGNFQDFYTQYKLPQASETVADPHQFLLEIAAVSGIAGAILFLFPLLGLAWEVGGWPAERERVESTGAQRGTTEAGPAGRGQVRWIYGGAIGGLLLGTCNAWLMGFPLESGPLGWIPLVWWMAAVLGTSLLVALQAWVDRGRLSAPLLLLAVVVILINLSAAGGISYPGVALPLWLLVSLVANRLPNSRGVGTPRPRSPWFSASITILLALSLATVHVTTVQPLLTSQTLLQAAIRAADFRTRLEVLRQAAVADPYSPEPYRYLSETLLQKWQETGEATDRAAFERSVERLLERDPHSRQAYTTAANWFLEVYRAGAPEALEQAVQSYQRAVELYPNSAWNRALLAWALQLDGRVEQARKQARLALELDDRTPHKELKLAEQTFPDPGPAATLSAEQREAQGPPPALNRTVREVMFELAQGTRGIPQPGER